MCLELKHLAQTETLIFNISAGNTFHPNKTTYSMQPVILLVFFYVPSVLPLVKKWTLVTSYQYSWAFFHSISSRIRKWMRPWREIVSRPETECKCTHDQGHALSGEGQKIDIMHLCSLCISPAIALMNLLFLYHYSFPVFSTAESQKWQHIKHLGTEAPQVLISTSLASKMIISSRERFLDGR